MQDWNRFPNFLAGTTFVLVSLWETKIPGQDAIFGDFVPIFVKFWYFVQYTLVIPEVCAQGWYSGSTPVLFVEFGSFFFTFFFIFSSYLCTFFGEFTFFCRIYGLFCCDRRLRASFKTIKILASRLFSWPCLSQILSSTPVEIWPRSCQKVINSWNKTRRGHNLGMFEL